MISAPGLGSLVLQGIRTIDLGVGIIAGLGIVLQHLPPANDASIGCDFYDAHRALLCPPLRPAKRLIQRIF